MPLYYFHVTSVDCTFRDADGASYFDLESAKSYARRLARELRDNPKFAGFDVCVVDAVGREVFRVPVGATERAQGVVDLASTKSARH